jgi:hypothetical protein
MKKLLLIAALAASMVSHAELTEAELKNLCINVKYELIEITEVMDNMEAEGMTVPPEYVEAVLDEALRYVTHCSELTGPLFEEI